MATRIFWEEFRVSRRTRRARNSQPDSRWIRTIRAQFRRIEKKNPKLLKSDSRESGGHSGESLFGGEARGLEGEGRRFSRIRPDSRESPIKVILENRGVILENRRWCEPDSRESGLILENRVAG